MNKLLNTILNSAKFKQFRNSIAKRFMQRIWRITHRTSVELKQISKSRVLVIAPHRDDETFACGGLLLLHKLAGSEIGVIFVTDSAGTSDSAEERQLAKSTRQKETALVQQQLKFEIIEDLDIPDGRAVRFETQIGEGLKRGIEKFQPDVVIAPTAADNHRDHQASAMGTALALDSTNFKGQVWSYELWSAFWPNVLIDITQVQKEKDELIHLYASQLEGMTYAEAISGLNRYRGLSVQVDYAESYFVGSASEYIDCANLLNRI